MTGGRVPRWVVTVVMLAVLVGAGLGVNALAVQAPPNGPAGVRMSLGVDAVVHPLQLNVSGARAYETVLSEDDVPLETVGVWVLVDLSYATTDRPRGPGDFILVDERGRRYAITSRDFDTWQASPDLWVRGTLVFEVPLDALGDLTLESWASGEGPPSDTPLPYGVLDLSVDPGAIEPGPAVISEPELLPAGQR
ncbi:hypothetical protein EXU48_15930 [Occultella glacieicola]|uniref:DUF4352 domain-containing protein n=1 Tax=Occultella glacieicola TaxID=2518684 RepID=A0ABY2E136_9MICO|nr:hypothetical protein [Occultella glacieicola]TDE91630.1 hypothetical protein EXU48_15930 [Occultella glacieicola]